MPGEGTAMTSRVKLPKPTLQKLAPSDNIESFIDLFEQVATQQGWPVDVWPTQLAGLLLGDALDAFTFIPLLEANNYSKVQSAILSRYEVNAETYRLQFQENRQKSSESNWMFLS